MLFVNRKCVLLVAFLFLVVFAITECKRGGGRRGGTYSRSSSVWGRSKQSQNGNYDLYGTEQRRSKSQSSDAQPDTSKTQNVAPNTQKASAPPAPSNHDTQKTAASSASFIQQEKKQQAVSQNAASSPLNTANVPQNTANAQRPIGWDVGQGTKTEGNINKNVGWNVGNNNPAHSGTGGVSYPSSSNLGNQQAYPHAGAYPNTGASNYGTGTNYNYGSGYHQQHNPNHQAPGYYPGSNTGGVPPAGNYYNGMNGMGNHYGGYGGGSYGNNYGSHGYGGYGGNGGFGGLGGWGGNGVGGYGKRFGGGFGSGFGKHAFRNVMVGLLVWNLVSGFNRRPYYVYNYYNNPEKIPQEIPLPANSIVLCPENVTTLCAPNTVPLCTSNSTILCVALAQQTVPCGDNSTLNCVKSTVSCGDGTAEPCDDKEKKNATTSVNIPCVTNATIIGKIMDNTTVAYSGTGTILNQGNAGDTTKLCVTTLALPQPEEEAKTNQEALSLCNNGTIACSSNSTELPHSMGVNLNTTDSNLASSTLEPLAM